MQHIVITGASSGIGAALACHYAKPGTILTLSGRHAGRLAEVAELCRQQGGEAVEPVVADVTDAAAMQGWLLQADDRHPVDHVIANAGIAGAYGLEAEDRSATAISREVLMTNAVGVINTVAPLVPRMAQRRRGHITLMSSMAAYYGFPRAPAYSAAKAAVRVYGEALRYLLLSHGVGVTVVICGFVETPMSAALPFVGRFMWPLDRAVAHITKGIALNRAQIVFPWQLRCTAAVVSAMPQSVRDYLFTRPQGHWLTG